MASLQIFAAAALLIVAGGGLARAVDLPPAPALPAAETTSSAFSGWYLRGDLGVGIETAPNLDPASAAIEAGVPPPRLSPFAVSSFANTTLTPSGAIDGGVGYVFNSWLRMDATLEYRFGGELRSTYAIGDPAPPRRDRAVPLGRPPPRPRLVDRRAGQRLCRSRQVLGRDALRRRRHRRRRQCALRRLGPGLRHRRGERDRPRRRVLLQRLEDEFRLGADGGVRCRPRAQPEARGELPLSLPWLDCGRRPALRSRRASLPRRRGRRRLLAQRARLERPARRPRVAHRRAAARAEANRRPRLTAPIEGPPQR